MPWREFKQLLSGLSPDTALGRIVAIRAENDKDILKHFTPEQRRIRNEWRLRTAKAKSAEETENVIEQFKQMFINMAGGEVKHGDECRRDRP